MEDFPFILYQIKPQQNGKGKRLQSVKSSSRWEKETNKWLAEQLGKDPATISKWCTNSAQPGLETLYQIAECLEVDVKDLLVSTKEENIIIYKKWHPNEPNEQS